MRACTACHLSWGRRAGCPPTHIHTHTPLPGDFGPVARRLTGHLLSAAGLTRCCGGLTDGEPRALALRAHGDVAERLQPRIGGKDAPER